MTKKELKQHIYELSCALDIQSARKNYMALRRIHYDNIIWLREHGLIDEYYEVFCQHIESEE